MNEILNIGPSDSSVRNGVLTPDLDVRDECEAVHLGEGISGISSVTFSGDRVGMRGVRRIVLPESLRNIAQEAFLNCPVLKDVRLPSGLVHLAASAFRRCDRLARLPVDPANPVYRSRGGLVCSKDGRTVVLCPPGRRAVRVPKGIVEIADGAFSDCVRLASAQLPDTLTRIGDLAFSGCTALKSIVLPPGLKSVELPSSVAEVGAWAFADCRRLTKLTFPASVKSIGESAFYGCRALEEIVFEGNLPKLPEQNPFASLPNLRRVVAADRTIIEYRVRGGLRLTADGHELLSCSRVKSEMRVPAGVMAIHAGAFGGRRHLASLTLPDGLKEIGDRAFKGCEELSSIHIPASVERIGACAFCGCGKLTSIDVDPANPHFRTRNGLLCSGDGATVLACPHGLDAVEIPADVTALGDGAFCHCAKLDNLNLPAGVSRIGKGAFYRMKESARIWSASEDVAQLVRDVLDEQARERQARMDEVDRVIDEILNA